jgi:C-terminal processing protease CtpA/Prc
MATIISDFGTSPLQYRLALPIEPRGTLNDLDHDGAPSDGVRVYAVTFRLNVHGDRVIDERDYLYTFGPWLTYSSMRLSKDAATKYNIIGGKLLLYSPNSHQGFPSGFGADGILFTDDDPIVLLPPGYTVVNLDTEPFTFDRSRSPFVNLIEPDVFTTPNFSTLTYTQAFDELIAKMRRDYAFTEMRGIDWDALLAEFRPRFEAAEANGDSFAYQLALRDFSWRIPDGHLTLAAPELNDLFRTEISGGLGVAIRGLDDGRVLVNFVAPDSPAAAAGIQLRAEILSLNGLPVNEAISANQPWSAPFSSEHIRRLQQERYVMRFPVDTQVELTYRNPDGSEPATVTLTTVRDPQSFAFSSFNAARNGFEFPVEFELRAGYGLAQINSFGSSYSMTIEMWEHIIDRLNAASLPALIIDMRQNGGGESYLAETMAAYFFDEPLVTGTNGFYAPDAGTLAFHPRDITQLHPPAEAKRYHGEVAVLVGPACASACELFANAMTLNDRAQIIGQYPSAGLGGGVTALILPENLFMQYSFAPKLGENGTVIIEGTGVIPTIRVPVDEETVFSAGDPVLDAAVTYLNETVSSGE